MIINNWLNGQLAEMHPLRVVATIEAKCNLQCEHCYWPKMDFKSAESWESAVTELKRMEIPLIYAGRMLTKPGKNFLNECVTQGVSFSIIDSGYTVLNAPEFLPLYSQIAISIDGWKEAHDKQRGKIGAFDKAWETVIELKRQGFDPVVSAAFSPLTFEGWDRFEDLLGEHDVPLSSTLIWSLPESEKRGTAIFKDSGTAQRAFEKLLGGIPKLINLSATAHLKVLQPILSRLPWEKCQDEGDHLASRLANGTVVLYRPHSVLLASEVTLHWDGKFYTTATSEAKVKLSEVGPSYLEKLQRLNREELSLWKGGDIACQP